MEQKLIQAVCGLLVAGLVWNFKTLNSLQLAYASLHAEIVQASDFQSLKTEVARHGWILQDLAAEK